MNSIFNYIFQIITSILFLSKLTDYTVGYRIYNTKAIKQINFKNTNQSFSLESILIPIRKKLIITEIPYQWKKRTEAISQNNFINKLKYFFTIVECRFRKLN